jgi:lipopolysaccharide/colanic/teichoic acid biosynthesis glycosyltransferase
MARIRPLEELLDIALIVAGFGAALTAYRFQYPDNFAYFTSDEMFLGFVTSVTTFWIVVKLAEVTSTKETLPLLIDEFCMGTGLNLLVAAFLNYLQVLTRSLYLIVVGGVFVVLLLGIARFLMPRRRDPRAGTLLVGFDPTALQLAISLGEPVIGVVGGVIGAGASCPPEIPFLGDEDQLEHVIAQRHPLHILAAGRRLSQISRGALFTQRLRGVPVLEARVLYEKLLRRVYCRGAQPMGLLLSGDLAANNGIQALQAIYTNLIGLLFLILLSPVLSLTGLMVAFFSGPGPMIDTTECSGFYNIPFQLLSFRTTRKDGTGKLTRVGSLISRLHLVRLPQLLNIIRGEMALFGPRPVRHVFTQRLTEIMPFYSMRLFVKPGLLGWAKVNMPPHSAHPNDLAEIEYDLYYVKEGSPVLDLEILARSFFPAKSSRVAREDLAVPAQ